jgi:hypothetical protein
LFGIVLVLVALGVLSGQGAIPWLPGPAPAPYGGGTIVFQDRDAPFRSIRVSEGPAQEWKAVELDPPPPAGSRHVFRSRTGGLTYIGVVPTEEGPDVVELAPNETSLDVFSGPGDHSFLEASPDGGRVLLLAENTGKPTFSHSLYWADLGDIDTKHLIFEGDGPLGTGRWSPDGDLVAFNIWGRTDSLAVYSLNGDPIWTYPFEEIRGLDWCLEGIIASVTTDAQPQLFRVDPLAGEVSIISTPLLSPAPVCSPDGSAVLHLDILEGHPTFVIRDIQTGEAVTFPPPDPSRLDATWLPEEPTPIPNRVKVELDTIRVRWGDKESPLASVIRSDGMESLEGIWWESLDPAVANFDSDQKLTGNQVGTTRVLARWKHSLLDTVVVIVEENEDANPASVIRARWENVDTTRWIPFGTHPPEVVTLNGESVLEIRGDEKYADGMITDFPISLTRGITVELEFRMEIDRDVHQRLSLSIRDFDPDDLDRQKGTFPRGEIAARVAYPARDLKKLDLSELSLLVSPSVETRVRIPDALPTGDWTHVALQIRADGESSMVVNRQRVATSPVLLNTTPAHQWNLVLEGDAVGTRLFIRNLNIWPEVRY